MDGDARARRHAPALARRQLRLRLQLEGRHRPARPAAGAPRPRLGRARDQPLRHRRVPAPTASGSRSSPTSASTPASARWRTPATGWSTRTRRANTYWAQQRRKNGREQALEREDLGPRQRDRRPLAARPQERRGLRQVRAGGGQGHAPRGRLDQADRLRLLELRPGRRLGRLEPHRARAAQRTRSTTSRSTPTSATATNNFEQFLALRPGPRRPHRGREGPDPGGAGRQPATRAPSTSPSTSGTSGTARSCPA